MPTPVPDTMRTRSGLAINKALQPLKPLPHTRSRRSKSTKIKKAQKNKAKPENRIAKLEQPLSELTKGWDHVPIVDIEAYVNRPAEERRKEVEEGKIPGKVKRPMNSFMLYRKAYQNRTKNWCLQNNHQVVSQVCGDSWPLEPESVREQFNEWSRIERINHQNAHPGYKFSPSKGTPVKSSKRKVSEEPTSEESDLDDFDWERGSSKRHKMHPRSTSRPVDNRSYGTSLSPYGYPQSRQISEEPSLSTYNKSSYQASNPGKPIPAPYNQSNLHHGQYYQQIVHQNMTRPGLIEDVVIKKTAAPGMGHFGLPGGHSYTITDPYLSQEGTMTPEHRIDPSLIAQDHGIYGGGYGEQESMYPGGNLDGESQWQGPFGKVDRGLYQEDHSFIEAPQSYNGMQIHEQQLQMLKGSQEGWSVEPLDVGQEFDKWMDEV
jgi:HMG (high mobility group) box